jgi:MFS transporter, ACS family, tartrate transporter
LHFWALPTAFLSGTAAATEIALTAAVGNLSGFAGPTFTGAMEDATGGFETPLTVLALLLAAGSLLALLARGEGLRRPTLLQAAGDDPGRAAASVPE